VASGEEGGRNPPIFGGITQKTGNFNQRQRRKSDSDIRYNAQTGQKIAGKETVQRVYPSKQIEVS